MTAEQAVTSLALRLATVEQSNLVSQVKENSHREPVQTKANPVLAAKDTVGCIIPAPPVRL